MGKLSKFLEVYKCVILTAIAILLVLPWFSPVKVQVWNTVDVEGSVKVEGTVEVEGTVSVQK